MFLVGNLVTWRSKKQVVVVRSSTEAEYLGMAHTACELKWIKKLLREWLVKFNEPHTMLCDNQAVMHIIKNPLYHERTKHIEVDYHFIKKVVMKDEICNPYIQSIGQLGDLFTKTVPKVVFFYLFSKLCMQNVFAPS